MLGFMDQLKTSVVHLWPVVHIGRVGHKLLSISCMSPKGVPDADGVVQVGQSALIFASGTLQLFVYGILTNPIIVVFT